MKKNVAKIGIFKNKDDIEIVLSNDNVINITGMMGSGKTSLARSILYNKSECDYVKLDWLFGYGYDKNTIPKEINELIMILKKEYPQITDDTFFRWSNNKKYDANIEKRYVKYVPIFYNYIVNYFKNSKLLIIDGVQLYNYLDIDKIKGKLIIKRSSLFTCYRRAFKRDVSIYLKRYISKQIKLKLLLKKIKERIKLPIKNYLRINEYISILLKQKVI